MDVVNELPRMEKGRVYSELLDEFAGDESALKDSVSAVEQDVELMEKWMSGSLGFPFSFDDIPGKMLVTAKRGTAISLLWMMTRAPNKLATAMGSTE